MKKKAKIFSVYSTFVLVLLGMFACDRARVFEEWKDLDAMAWHEDSAYSFTFVIEDTTVFYNMNFGIRNTNVYPYQNLWLLVDITGPEGFSYQDTIKVVLANTSGQWQGKRSASLYTYVMPLYRQLLFPKTGSYTIKMTHGMRQEILQGVSSLGFRLEYVDRSQLN